MESKWFFFDFSICSCSLLGQRLSIQIERLAHFSCCVFPECHLVILLSINSPTRNQKQIKKVLLWKSEVSHLRLTQPPYLTAVCSGRSYLISLGLIFLAFKIKVEILYHRVHLGLNCRGALETERESKYVTVSGLN